jgi:AbrB family looped-hinge helix DNA binding protein
MEDIIEMATVSSRGQICIPNKIREKMFLKDGSKIIFALTGDSLLMKKVSMETFEEITAPLKEAKKKIREDKVVDLIHKIRKEKRE